MKVHQIKRGDEGYHDKRLLYRADIAIVDGIMVKNRDGFGLGRNVGNVLVVWDKRK